MTYTLNECIKKLESYCAYQERCHYEVEQKLWEIEAPRDLHDEVMMHLVNNNFLNEERYAKAVVRGKFLHKKWGRIKIMQWFKQKKVSEYCVKVGLSEIDPAVYQTTLQSLYDKKSKLTKAANAYQKDNKIAQYLISKGYESHLVWETIKRNQS